MVPSLRPEWYENHCHLLKKALRMLRINLGRIPVIVDNTQNPPFSVMETSAELLYLLKFADKQDKYGFKDELARNQCLQWLFFAHGSMAPYQGKLPKILSNSPIKCETLQT